MANRHGHVLHLCHDGQLGFGLVMDASEINKFVARHAGQDAILAPLGWGCIRPALSSGFGG